MNCKYFTEMEFNNYFTTPDNFSLFNLNIRSLPKNVVNLQHFLEGININNVSRGITLASLRMRRKFSIFLYV